MSPNTQPIPTNLNTPAVRPVAALELHAFAAWQAQRGLSERTITERALLLARLSAPFTTERIELFLGDRSLGQNTRATYWAHCAAYTKWLLVSGRIDRNPMDRLMAPRRIPTEARPLSDAQIEAMLAVADRHRTRVMILLGAFAGMRVSEIGAMRGDWVDLWTDTLTITGKGGATRSIPLHEVLREVAQSMPRRGWWFPSYDKMNPSKPHIVRQAVHAAISGTMERAGIYGSTPHQLRHWYGTSLLEGDVDIRVVQVLMRHRSIASTQIYTRVSRERLDHGIATLRLPGAGRSDEPPEVGAAA